MPIHNWSDARIFHDFQTRWITHIAEKIVGAIHPGIHVLVVEATDATSHRGVPGRWREVIEGEGN